MNLKLLKQKDFLLLILGKFTSLLGTEIQSFALSLYVLKITGSTAQFASVLAIALLPQLILGPFAGVLADWFDRKKIIVYLDLLRGVIVGIFAIIFITNGKLSLTSIYALVLILSFASLLFQPAIGAVIPSIVKKEDLVGANSVNTIAFQSASLIAPAVGGVLYGLYGLFIVLVVNSISFILSAISEMFINIPKVNKKPEKINFKTFKNDFMEGIKFLKTKKLIFTIIITACILNFAFTGLDSIGLIHISKKILFISDFQYGVMQSVIVVASMLGALVCPFLTKKISVGKAIFLSIFVSSLLVAVMAVIPSKMYLNLFSSNFVPYISIIVIMSIMIMIISVSNVLFGALIQREVPVSMIGRVGTVMGSLSMGAVPLGQLIFGVLYDKLPAPICILISAALLCITILIARKNLFIEEGKDSNVSPKLNAETVKE